MASSLLSNINSESQYQANLLTNTPNLVSVIVEDELDVVIWYRILKKYAPNYKFNVHPFSYDPEVHGKGKAQILAQSDRFGKYCFGCVDSDYDWLLSTWSPAGSKIVSSPYILQTYAYSIENLAAQPSGIKDCMIECCLHCDEDLYTLDEDYRRFILNVSEMVYPVLLWHLTMKKYRPDTDQVSIGRNHIFNNEHYNDIHNDHALSIAEKHNAVLERLSNRATELVNNYEKDYPELIQSRDNLEIYLRETCNLSSEVAYLFVRGHNLHDFLMHNFFNPVYSQLVESHKAEICAHIPGTETKNALDHYKKLRKDFSKEYIHRHSYIIDIDSHPSAISIMERIRTDILHLLQS